MSEEVKKTEAQETPKVEEVVETKVVEAPVEAKVEEAKTEKVEEEPKSIEGDAMASLVGAKIEVRGGEKFIKLEDLPPDSMYTMDQMVEFEKLYENTLTEIKEGEVVEGRGNDIGDKEVAVDIGIKSEGSVSLEE